MDNLVIFFRDQKMTIDQHKDFGRRFGPLHVHPNAPIEIPEHPEILVIKADEKSKHVAGEEWHSDVSCDVEPPMGSILHLTEVPPDGGGDTMFANMYRAFETLSDADQADAAGPDRAPRQRQGARLSRQGDRPRRDEVPQRRASRRAHPSGDRQAGPQRQSRLHDAHPAARKNESEALLEMLYRHIETPEFQCRFQWRPNSVAFWDNRCAQHHAMFDYFPHRRYGHRVTVCGDKPFYGRPSPSARMTCSRTVCCCSASRPLAAPFAARAETYPASRSA